jgi:hypothetical protein
MQRLGVNSVLIVPSQGVDEYPVWSSDGNYLAANVEGKWCKIDLAHLTLSEGTWRGGKKIGVISSKSSIAEAAKEEIEKWQKTCKMHPRKTQTTTGIRIELRKSGLGISLIVAQRGAKPLTFWTTEMENCHGLVISPDQNYVAFISEESGVVIFKL